MKTSKRVLYFVAFVTTAFYLTWRLVATIPWHDSWFALIFGILLWGSEVVSAITGYILIWNKQKDFELEKPEIAKERYPDVDVLIATHKRIQSCFIRRLMPALLWNILISLRCISTSVMIPIV